MATYFNPLEDLKRLQHCILNASSVDEFLKSVCHAGLKDYGAIGCFMVRLVEQSRIFITASYGYPYEGRIKLGYADTLWDSSATSEALRSGEIVFYASKAAYLDRYPEPGADQLPGDGVVAIPIWGGGYPIGALVVALDSSFANREQLGSAPVWEQLKVLLELACKKTSWQAQFEYVEPTTSSITVIPTGPAALTTRQLEILQLMALGDTNRQIAAKLHVSESTVGKETVEIYNKIGVHSRSDAARIAEELGLLAELSA